MRILHLLDSTMGSIPSIKTYVLQTIQLCNYLSEQYRFTEDITGIEDGHISDIPLGITCCLAISLLQSLIFYHPSIPLDPTFFSPPSVLWILPW